MSFDELPEMLRVDEAASLLRIGRSAAYEAVAQFEATGGRTGIPCIRIGGPSGYRAELCSAGSTTRSASA